MPVTSEGLLGWLPIDSKIWGISLENWKQIQLTLEQHGFELHGSTSVWIFSNSKDDSATWSAVSWIAGCRGAANMKGWLWVTGEFSPARRVSTLTLASFKGQPYFLAAFPIEGPGIFFHLSTKKGDCSLGTNKPNTSGDSRKRLRLCLCFLPPWRKYL